MIELILVLVLITIVISLVMPSLAKFFGGRAVDSEVRQFVALTHYAQSRAVSEGIPMVVWVDSKAGTYGLRQEPGYSDNDSKAIDYKVGEGLAIKVASVGINVGAGTSTTTSVNPKNARVTSTKYTGIHFSPDGNIINATSVTGVAIQQGQNPPVWIKPDAGGLSYEVRN